MEKPEHHIFVCMSFRGLEPKGKCIKKNAPDLLGYLESEMAVNCWALNPLPQNSTHQIPLGGAAVFQGVQDGVDGLFAFHPGVPVTLGINHHHRALVAEF